LFITNDSWSRDILAYFLFLLQVLIEDQTFTIENLVGLDFSERSEFNKAFISKVIDFSNYFSDWEFLPPAKV